MALVVAVFVLLFTPLLSEKQKATPLSIVGLKLEASGMSPERPPRTNTMLVRKQSDKQRTHSEIWTLWFMSRLLHKLIYCRSMLGKPPCFLNDPAPSRIYNCVSVIPDLKLHCQKLVYGIL